MIGAAAEKEARSCFCRGMGRPRYRQGYSALPGNVHQEAGPSGPRSGGKIQDCGPSFNSLRSRTGVQVYSPPKLKIVEVDMYPCLIPATRHYMYSSVSGGSKLWTIVRDPTPIFSHAHHL